MERDRDTRDRSTDIRDVFTRDLNLPRGLELTRILELHRSQPDITFARHLEQLENTVAREASKGRVSI